MHMHAASVRVLWCCQHQVYITVENLLQYVLRCTDFVRLFQNEAVNQIEPKKCYRHIGSFVTVNLCFVNLKSCTTTNLSCGQHILCTVCMTSSKATLCCYS